MKRLEICTAETTENAEGARDHFVPSTPASKEATACDPAVALSEHRCLLFLRRLLLADHHACHLLFRPLSSRHSSVPIIHVLSPTCKRGSVAFAACLVLSALDCLCPSQRGRGWCSTLPRALQGGRADITANLLFLMIFIIALSCSP